MANSDALRNILVCPISAVFFHDPVLAEDSYTYERQAIETWIRQHGRSPLTGEPLSIGRLYPNRIVKQIVDSFETLTQNKQYQFTLNVDVRKKPGGPLFRVYGKAIYYAEWLPNNENRPNVVLMQIDGARARKEASFYVKLTRHPHIVRTFGFVHDRDSVEQNRSVLLLQEFASSGSLYELLQNEREALDEKVLIHMFLQIVEAMIYLASNNVVHGDLACRNVLVFRFDRCHLEKNIVKITDFGLSRHSALYSMVSSSACTTLNIVPVRYAAPEVLLDSANSTNYTEKSDVYSMGVLMWEAYTRFLMPWADIENDNDIVRRVIQGDRLPQPSSCSQPYWSIIVKTWAQSPTDRPTFSELKHLLAEQYYRGIPRWKQIAPGICLEGPCSNQLCEAYNQGNVIICLGMREFDVVGESDETTTKCPMCSMYVETKACAFNKCRRRWSGIKQPWNGQPIRVSEDWKIVDDEYERFTEDRSGTFNWRQLKFEAKPL
ncbi:unnamed protein product [Adineta ricciae]|uniref:Non-specific protein-tyrosine kinase n=1 Tax=Adineta ricciae TaxID=249248 RepID=A0A815CY65_ADIRI|nr:unnamed protein product [Adineta ricciae]